MRRLVYVLAFVLPAAMMFSLVDANAQRKNTTSHDVKVVHQTIEETAPAQPYQAQPEGYYRHDKMMRKDGKMMKNCDCGCKKDKNCMGNCVKKQQGRYIEKETAEIDEDYNKALNKINKSGFNKNQKDILAKQASENRDLAVKQVNERAALRKYHMQQRMEAGMSQMMDEKANRKAVKKVMEID